MNRTMLDYANTKNFGAYLDQTYKIIKQQYQRAFRHAGIDITPEQWIVLSNLYEKDGPTQKDLAGHSFKHAATLSRIVDLLGRRGLLERRPDDADKRSYRIYLTDAGRVLVEQAFPVVLELRRVGWKGNSDADYEQLVRILNTVCDNFMSET
ncbi:MAG: MarR family transcriptional regulator [Rhodothermales bacterium]